MTVSTSNTPAQSAVSVSTNPVWFLKDGYPQKCGLKCFSTFSCGGGSTMGYKLAGFEVLGCVEIDKKCFHDYTLNHNPKHGFNMPLSDFNELAKKKEIPEELFSLDVLDGSPPCSSFSMAGSREKKWGKETYFREGQEKQVLDDLFFQYLETVELLKPKIAVAENVQGMLAGNAKYYCSLIVQKFREIGYNVKLYLLDAADSGVPQVRRRVFFIATRKDVEEVFTLNKINRRQISAKEAIKGLPDTPRKKLSASVQKWADLTKAGDTFSKVHPRGSFFNCFVASPNKPVPTLIASGADYKSCHWSRPRRSFSEYELKSLGTFPQDYQAEKNNIGYLIGMSVPPYLIRDIALQLRDFLLK